jgi:hypothetical protein
MIKKYLVAIAILSVVVLATTACKLPTAEDMRQPDYGGNTEAQVSQAVVDDIAGLFDDIRDGEQTGPIERTFTESQLTAVIAQEIGNAPDVPISNVIINIDPEVMIMAANLNDEGNVRAIVAEFTLEANGESVIVTLGDFTVDGLLASLVPALKQKFIDEITAGLRSATDDPEMVLSAVPIPEGATISSIVLGDRQITVIGTVTVVP